MDFQVNIADKIRAKMENVKENVSILWKSEFSAEMQVFYEKCIMENEEKKLSVLPLCLNKECDHESSM